MNDNILFGNKPLKTENLRMTKNSISTEINVISGKDGDIWVVISPSLNVSGYGKNKEDAKESFSENMDLFWEDLKALKMDKRRLVLKELGWKNKKFASKQYSKAFVDENGVLQNLKSAQINALQTEAA